MKENQNKERFEQLGTKIDPAMAEVLNACCDALQVDVYHLLQWFAYVIVKAAAPMHGLDPRIQKLMTLMESDVGWQKAFNQCNPDRLKIDQVIVILEQEGHKGFGAAMIDKPWMGESRQTECVDDILERVTQVLVPGIYKRIRQMEKRLGTDSLMDTLLTMLDAQEFIEAVEGDRSEGPQMGDVADNGRRLEYGKRTKRKKRFDPDTLPEQVRIHFTDYDKRVAESEVDHDS
jgi:hypothetical protein